MTNTEGEKLINDLKRRWILFSFLEAVLVSLTISIIITAVAVHFFDASSLTFIPVLLAALSFVTAVKQYWKLSSFDISRYLNNRYPELEESAGLILKPEGSLSFLQQLQARKVLQSLEEIPPANDPVKKLKHTAIFLLAGILVSVIILNIPAASGEGSYSEQNMMALNPVKEKILPEINSFKLTISPPAYTSNPKRVQKQFSLKAESEAVVNWEIKTNTVVKSLHVIFNDKEDLKINPAKRDSTLWAFSKKIDRSGFYQLKINGKLSDLYQVDAIPDQPVSIKINSPKEAHSTIDIGQPQMVRINVSLWDDYGITSTYISATMASGKGEAVSFREQKISFNNSPAGKKQFLSEKTVDMKALGMKPGDELYFFVSAFDNHGQENRSDIYFVSIQDTSELMSLSGLASGVNLVPEYFRSQRQIIIDTEKLLKERSSLSTEEFNTRSNNLGIDQKLLRLRYGKFLGEENETTIGEGHDDDHKAEVNPVFGDATAIMDQFTHHTDNSEDATFYEPELKAKLKATLTEMWSSELRLRTYKPEDALPYEYKALRLLKELQQNSRVYVAKTTVKTTALKPEKRLSAELGKILEPVKKGSFEQQDDKITPLKTALALLESLKAGAKLDEQSVQLLTGTEKQLVSAAASNPAAYLAALKAIKKIQSGDINNITIAQAGIRRLLGTQMAVPQSYSTSLPSKLDEFYFNNLKKLSK